MVEENLEEPLSMAIEPEVADVPIGTDSPIEMEMIEDYKGEEIIRRRGDQREQKEKGKKFLSRIIFSSSSLTVLLLLVISVLIALDIFLM